MGSADNGGGMTRATDLTGRVFGRLTVQHRSAPKDRGRGTWWHCLCSCGERRDVRADLMLNGATKSCGCHRRENGRVLSEKMRAALSAGGSRRQRTERALAEVLAPRARVNIPAVSRNIGGGKSGKTTRIAQAFDAVFRPAPDYVHVDTPGARVVRGSRY